MLRKILRQNHLGFFVPQVARLDQMIVGGNTVVHLHVQHPQMEMCGTIVRMVLEGAIQHSPCFLRA